MTDVTEVRAAYTTWQRSKETEIASGWAFADKVLAYTSEHGRGSGKALAEDLDMNASYLSRIKMAAEKFAVHGNLRDVSLTTAIEAMAAGIDPVEGMTSNSIRNPHQSPAKIVDVVTKAPADQRREMVRGILSDPQTVRDAVADPAIDSAITNARHDHLEDRLAVESEYSTEGRRVEPDMLAPTSGDEKRQRFEKALANAVVVASVIRELSNDNELLVVSAANAGQYRERIRWALEGLMESDSQWEIVQNTNTAEIV